LQRFHQDRLVYRTVNGWYAIPAESLEADEPAPSFDDLTISSQFHPYLTTMKIDNQQIGLLAAEQLLSAIDGARNPVLSIELMPQLKIRESTGTKPAIG
jgi:hypothetical protein